MESATRLARDRLLARWRRRAHELGADFCGFEPLGYQDFLAALRAVGIADRMGDVRGSEPQTAAALAIETREAQVVVHWATVKLEAERKAGRMLGASPKRAAFGPAGANADSPSALADLGIEPCQQPVIALAPPRRGAAAALHSLAHRDTGVRREVTETGLFALASHCRLRRGARDRPAGRDLSNGSCRGLFRRVVVDVKFTRVPRRVRQDPGRTPEFLTAIVEHPLARYATRSLLLGG